MSSHSVLTLQLNEKILPGLVTLGHFLENTWSLVTVTTSNKISIRELGGGQVKEDLRLNMSKPITSIATARFKSRTADVLLICTKTSLLVYDVQENKDVFSRDVADGGNVVAFGEVAGRDVILVGGNCSVQGFDEEGGEPYWIVTGDNVRSLALLDVDGDGDNEVVVGSDDYDIRVFKNDDLNGEITETQIVTHLHAVGNALFAYALANGTVGVYEKLHRLWRVKSKNRATCLLGFDINGDGTMELLTGWQGGKVDGRSIKTGEVVFKDNLGQSIAGMCCGGTTGDLLVVSITGEVRGYNPSAPKPLKNPTSESSQEQDAIRQLLNRKQNLLLELKNYESSARFSVEQGQEEGEGVGAIPVRTRLQTAVGVHLGSTTEMPHVEIALATNNETVVRAVIVFAEGIFKGETHVRHPKLYDVDQKISIALYPPRDVPIDIHIKALVGYADSKQYHVFELTRQLPRFAMYTIVQAISADIQSSVVFFVNDRIQRIVLWINRNFLLPNPLEISGGVDLKVALVSLRDGKEATIEMDNAGKATLRTDNLTFAGDLIQSLASYLNLEHLKSTADFPEVEKHCASLMEKLQDLESAKRKLNIDLGDKSSLIRNLIIRSEDARLLNDLKLMKKFYMELNELNNELRGGYEIRLNNYKDIVDTVKELNGMIQKASRLRVGKHKNDPVMLARSAIATGNVSSLIKAIRSGEA